MQNESRYEKLRIEVRQLRAMLMQVMAHVGLEAPPMPRQEELGERRRETRGNVGQSFGGGASMRNNRLPTGAQSSTAQRKLGRTVGSDGTLMTVRQVQAGRPRVVPTPPRAAPAPQPVAAQPVAPAAPAPPASGNSLEALLISAASLVDALGQAAASYGIGRVEPETEAAGSEEQGEPEHVEGVAGVDDWMAAEGINAGPVVEQQG